MTSLGLRSAMPSTLLNDRGVLRVAGEQASALLQGLVTNDVATLQPGEARFAALLSPQGKILFDFIIVGIKPYKEHEFLIDCSIELVEALKKRLELYRLRAAVSIEDVSSRMAVAAEWRAHADGALTGIFFQDPRHPRAGRRAFVERSRPWSSGFAEAYEAHRIGLGLPKGGVDFAYGDAYPHETGMDRLFGLDFRKGCYVGQEVVSRMQHRGAVRSRILRIGIEGEAPPPFSEIRADEKLVGVMGSSVGAIGLAMLRLDRVEEAVAARAPITAGGATIRLLPSGEDGDQ